MTQNVYAENAMSFGVSNDLNHYFHVIAAKREAVSTTWESTDPHFNSLLLGLTFSETSPRQLRIGVNDTGNGFVVHVAGSPRNDFHASDSFVFGFVGQHRSRDDITDGINAFHIRAVMFVHFNAFLFIQF